MELPNVQNAEIPQAKIRGYLLSPTHRDGQHKAEFFTRFGFSVTAWQELAAALRQHAIDHEIAKEEDSPFGKRYSPPYTFFLLNGDMELNRNR